jgi:hypothetical protein
MIKISYADTPIRDAIARKERAFEKLLDNLDEIGELLGIMMATNFHGTLNTTLQIWRAHGLFVVRVDGEVDGWPMGFSFNGLAQLQRVLENTCNIFGMTHQEWVWNDNKIKYERL